MVKTDNTNYVVPQLKDLTAKKKALEADLERAVAGTHQGQELTELSGDQRNDLIELQNILDDVNAKGEEAREIIRQSFPRMLSKADAYGAFDFGSSANRYDTTLESIIEEIEEYYDEEEDDMDEEYKGKHQGSNYKWPMSKATKDRKEADKFAGSDPKAGSTIKGRGFDWKKEQVNEMDGGRLFDYLNTKYHVKDHFHSDDSYIVSRKSDSKDQYVIFDFDKDKDQFYIRQLGGYSIDDAEAGEAGMNGKGGSRIAGIESYYTDGNYSPEEISVEALKKIVDHVMGGLDREAEAQRAFYANRGHTSGTIDEELNEEATCCGKCGRVHVKGSGCKRPYLKGKKHCRTK